MARDAALEALLGQGLRARAGGGGVEPRPMFGGMGFMLGGHLAGFADSGGLMLRVGREAEAETLALPGVAPATQGARPMPGWVRLRAEACADAAMLGRLLDRGAACVAGLPARKPA